MNQIREIRAALAVHMLALCQELLPAGHREGKDWVCGDCRGQPGRSLKVCVTGQKAGLWHDFAEATGGDALDLIAAARDMSIADALRWARAWLAQPIECERPAVPPPTAPRSGRQRLAARLWRQGLAIPGTPAALYLTRRGVPAAGAQDLRYHPGCPHPGGGRLPALMAAVRDQAGQLVALHRTFLTPEGDKAEIWPNKALLGSPRGGAVRLAPAGPCLGLAEGIESALAVTRLFGWPCWASLGTAGMAAALLPVLPPNTRLLLCADPDQAGMRAARTAQRRMRAAGRDALVVVPASGGDFCDLLGSRMGLAVDCHEQAGHPSMPMPPP